MLSWDAIELLRKHSDFEVSMADANWTMSGVGGHKETTNTELRNLIFNIGKHALPAMAVPVFEQQAFPIPGASVVLGLDFLSLCTGELTERIGIGTGCFLRPPGSSDWVQLHLRGATAAEFGQRERKPWQAIGGVVMTCAPQGARNAPAVFQSAVAQAIDTDDMQREVTEAIAIGCVAVRRKGRLIQVPLSDYCTSFVDDVVCWGDDMETRKAAHLGLVKALQARGIKFHRSKTKYNHKERRFLLKFDNGDPSYPYPLLPDTEGVNWWRTPLPKFNLKELGSAEDAATEPSPARGGAGGPVEGDGTASESRSSARKEERASEHANKEHVHFDV